MCLVASVGYHLLRAALAKLLIWLCTANIGNWNCVPSGQRHTTYIDSDSLDAAEVGLGGAYTSTLYTGPCTKLLLPLPVFGKWFYW